MMRSVVLTSAFAAFLPAQQHRVTALVAKVPINPFVVNNGQIPPSSQYHGPMFKLSHNWPTKPLPPLNSAPWREAIGNKQITVENASAYAAALKEYVAPVARQLLLDPHFDASAAHWYNEPWLGSIRESIHGTYTAGQFGPGVFPNTGLQVTFDTHVLTYYDERAAYALYKVWSSSAAKPDVKTENFQFPEGSIIVKAAIFDSDDPKVQSNWWPATNGAAKWPMYIGIPIPQGPGPSPAPQVVNGYAMQFDIIVKDSVSAPKTGWVFSTLVYDVDAKGADAWDKMVLLGAQWGNDPQSNVNPALPLQENWINPAAPLYSTQTLGWGGRLTGPNDGGRNDIQVGTVVMKNAPDSSCMSCHSPAQWQPKKHKMVSFLFPSFPNPGTPPPPFKPCGAKGEYVCSPAPGSADWMTWFQDRLGTEPMNAGSVATDFDMVFAFKTLPMWWKAQNPTAARAPFATSLMRNGRVDSQGYNEYSGAPLKKK